MTSPAPAVPQAVAGSTPTAASGTNPPRLIRRRDNSSNPLVDRRKRTKPPPGARPSRTSATPPAGGTSLSPPTATSAQATPQPDEGEWQTFKLTTTKASLLKGLRHHVMRLQSKRIVDPLNGDQFTTPIRLHRRDPKAPLQGGKEQRAAEEQAEKEKAVEDEEKAKLEEEQAKRDAERQANLDKIAPYGGAQKQKKNAFKKKTQQVFKSNEADKKLRYEEYFPWHIEDFDNKNTWQGQLESSLSNGTFAMFVLDGSVFRMVPIEKWYKFTEKNKFKTFNIEEAEAMMKKSQGGSAWLARITKEEEKRRQREEEEASRAVGKKLYTVKEERLKNQVKAEAAEADELDYDEDRFDDDEGAPVMEGEDEENKEIEKRIKKEQLTANVFDTRDEKEYDKEEEEEKRREELRRKQGKKVTKYLMNREGNYTYESDTDDNPYATSDEEEDSDEELARKEEERKEEEKKKAEESKEQNGNDKVAPALPPAADAKAKVSPSKNKPKGTALAPVSSDKKGLKRSGSPDPSDSGAEKNRKKPRKNQPASSNTSAGQRTKLAKIVKLKVPVEKVTKITSLTPRPATGAPTKVPTKKRKPGPDGGSGSGEDTAGEMSDGSNGTTKRIKIVSRALSPPAGSASPEPRQGPKVSTGSKVGSRAGSPAAPGRARSPAGGPTGPITEQELLAIIPPEGITMGFIANKFRDRISQPENKAALIASLRKLTYTKDGKTHFKKPGV